MHVQHPFTLELKPEAARKMSRAQYKGARSWLRYVRRMIESGMDKGVLTKLSEDLVFYGSAVYRTTSDKDGSLKIERVNPCQTK